MVTPSQGICFCRAACPCQGLTYRHLEALPSPGGQGRPSRWWAWSTVWDGVGTERGLASRREACE